MASDRDISMASQIAPEDLRPGMYIAPLYQVAEYLPCFDTGDLNWNHVKLARVVGLPWTNVKPMKVLDVSLPFVLVADAKGEVTTIDVRRYRLARIQSTFAQSLFKITKARRAKTRSKKR